VLLNLRHFAPGPAEYVPRPDNAPLGGLAFAPVSVRALTAFSAYGSVAPERDHRAWVASAPEEDYEMHALRPRAEA
jgi:hypothetical protein